ncbi:MAG: helix-turn-helix transcriptional regulator [Gemmatimonadaceae bacterium]
MASLTLNWVQLAAALGALQGVLLAGVLWAQRKNRTANRLLASLIAAFTIYLAIDVYYVAGLVRVFPHLFGLSYPTPWLFGPLLYLYAIAASDRSWRFQRRTLVHFVLPALAVLSTLPLYFLSGAEKLALLDRMVAGDVPRSIALLDPTKFISGISYSVATVLYLRRHRQETKHSYSYTRRINLNWLLFLTVSAMGIWLLATLLDISDFGARLSENQVTFAIAFMVYTIGYMGLGQPEVFRYETAEHAIPQDLLAAHVAAVPTPETPSVAETAAPARYERSGLGDDEAAQLKHRLLDTMDRDTPWKDSELTLADLATRLESTPHKLSEVLNAQLGLTFYDFVNGYRVRDVQRRIQAGEARTRKMLALAMDAGFASKSTFNQAFKKHTNQTPSDFRTAADV